MPYSRQPTRKVAKSGLPEIDLKRLINRAANSFERIRNIRVSAGARQVLLEDALPYQRHVAKELAEGKISYAFLRASLHELLDSAARISRKRAKYPVEKHYAGSRRHPAGHKVVVEVDIVSVNLAKQRKCPYLFWC